MTSEADIGIMSIHSVSAMFSSDECFFFLGSNSSDELDNGYVQLCVQRNSCMCISPKLSMDPFMIVFVHVTLFTLH